MIRTTIKHVLIILLVVLILFPILWIITTSIRRDNAAFSTELLSNRLTLQNYKDLIFKTPNVPQRIAEMKKIVSISDEYSNLSRDELFERLNKEEESLRKQLQQSVSLVKKSDDSVEKIVSFAREKTGTVEKSFADIKSQEVKFLNAQLDDKMMSTDTMKMALSYELIKDLNKVMAAEKAAYLEIIKESLPEFVTAYSVYSDSLVSAAGEVQTEFGDWMTRVETNLDDETRTKLNDIQSSFIALLNPGDFSYSKWNREISLKGYKKVTSAVKNQVSEAEAEEWTTITDSFKTIAKNLDSARKEYEGAYSDSVAVYEKQIEADNATKKAYEVTEVERKRLYNGTVSAQGAIEVLEQEKMDLENRLSMLEDKMKTTTFELTQLKDLFTTEFQNPELASNDKLSVDKFDGYLAEAAVLHAELIATEEIAKNQMIAQQAELFDWFVQNSERIKMRYGYSSIKDGFKVFGNLISPTRLNTSDFVIIAQAQFDNKTAIDEKTTELDNLKAELKTITDELATQKMGYDEINRQSVQIAELKSILNLSLFVETVADYDSISAYNGMIEEHVSEFGLFENPSASVLSDISRMDKLVYFDRNYDTETKVLYKTVAQMEGLLDQFDERKETYLNLTFANVPIQINELTQLDQLQKTEYQKFSAELNRLGRIAIDLSELEEYASIKRDLTSVDSNIYETMQLWIKKPEQSFLLWLINTVILAILTAGLTVLICAFGAYPFSRLRFTGRKYGLLFLLLVQMFPTIMGMVALYLLLRFIGQFLPGFGLDSLGGLGVIYLGNIAFNMWLLKGYFDTIPNSLEEAAMIDGSTRFQTFWKIILPLAAPMLSVVFLIVFMANFNEYLLASVVLQSPEKYTFAVGLRSFAYSSEYQMEWGLFTAASLLGAIPMVILSLSLQKYLVSGLTSGAVKG